MHDYITRYAFHIVQSDVKHISTLQWIPLTAMYHESSEDTLKILFNAYNKIHGESS